MVLHEIDLEHIAHDRRAIHINFVSRILLFSFIAGWLIRQLGLLRLGLLCSRWIRDFGLAWRLWFLT